MKKTKESHLMEQLLVTFVRIYAQPGMIGVDFEAGHPKEQGESYKGKHMSDVLHEG